METWMFPKDADEFSQLTELTGVTYEGVRLKENYGVWLTADTFSSEGVEDTRVSFTLILCHRTSEVESSTWIELALENGQKDFTPGPFLQGKAIDLYSFMYPPTKEEYDNCWLGNLIQLIAAKEVRSVAVSYRPKELAQAAQVHVRVEVGEMIFVGVADLEEASQSLELA